MDILHTARIWKQLLFSLSLLAGTVTAQAQVTGTKTIGIDYATLAAAVTDLNTIGISGAVTISVPAGYTETAPAGGYQLGSTVLNGSTSATSTLTFLKSGSGTNPLLTAPVGTSTTVDGIFIIKGTDNVIINGISVTESAANIDPTTQMEWGYALVKLNATAPFDGCQNVTITNCRVTLNQTNVASTGIYSGNHIASSNTALTIAATTDAMNNCTFTGDTITNVNTGVGLNGFIAAASPYNLYDQNNGVTNNIITNFGGTTAPTYGINLAGQNNARANFNNITSAATPGAGIIRGIFHGIGNNSNFTASNNTLQLRASTGAIYGIANGTGAANSGVSGTGTVIFNNNTFQNYSFSAANSATHYFAVYNQGGTTSGWPLASVIMNNNIVQNMNNLSATGNIYLFYNYYCNANDVRFNNNKINSMFRSGTAGSTYCYYNYYGNPTGGADSVVGNKISNVSSPYNLYCLYDYMNATTRDRIFINDTLINDTASKGSTFYTLYGIYSYYGNNITIRNCQITNLTGVPTNSGYVYGIYRYYGNNVTVSNNNVANNNAYSNYGIYSSSAGAASTVSNNTVSNLSATSGTTYGVLASATGPNDVFNNTIKNLSSTTGAIYSLYNSGGSIVNFHHDTVYNVTTNGGAIYGFYNGGGTTINVNNLHLGRLTNGGTSGSVYGLYAISGTTLNFYSNLIDTLTTSATSGTAYGVYESGPGTFNCYKNKISYVSASGTGASVNGMYLNSGVVTAYNNLIGDLRTPAFTTSTAGAGTQLVGIYCGSGTSYNLYYNTVDINATSTGTNFGSTAIYASTTPTLTMINNVFVNTSTPAGTGIVAAFRRNTTSLSTYASSSDRNLFYAGTPSATTPILWDGTTAYATLADYKLAVAPRDGNSVTENVTFQSLSGIGNTFLHPSTTVATQIESNGTNIPGITDDHYGTIRAGNPGYTGTGVAPDLGAVEDNYIPLDLSAPNMTYTALAYTCATGDRTFTATITDITGVPTAGTLVPRVYYRKGTGAWFSMPGTLTSGSATSGTWSFTIVAADMGGLVVGDVVSYFTIAQDLATTPNIGSQPSGALATDVNTIVTFPASPNSYNISTSLGGTYTVGAGGAFTTITSAVAAYNTGCLTGPVIFSLTDATYTAETFPIVIGANPFASATNTLTIRPAVGVSPNISASATPALFVFDGADYVIMDGSNNPIPNSVCPPAASSRNMTIKNASTSTSSAVVWLQSTSAGNGATHNIVRNTNIVGSGNTFTLFGIGSGGTTVGYTSNGNGNHFNRFENNSISATQTGIFTRGTSAASKNSGTIINQNLLNAAAPDNLRNNGIFTNFEDNITISGNVLANITNGISNDIIGINLGFNNNSISYTVTTGNDVTNATVTNNQLNNITQTNTYSCLGIALAGVPTGTTLIANNMVSGVVSNGTSGDFSSSIFIGGAAGGATNVFYNSVNVTSTTTGASYPNFAISISGSDPIVNLKNNIFVNNNTAGPAALQYAIGLAYTTYANLSSNNNDFYSIGTNLATVGSLATTGTPQPTLAAWRTTTGNDAASKNINPVFVSPSNLHVAPVAANVALMDSGTVVSVTTDIDCAPRGTTPDIGINEFTIPPCGAITAGTISVATPAFCGTGSTNLTLPTASTGLGILYQWYSSADSVTWTPISGAVADHYTTPALTATTYYRVKAVCSLSGSTDSASASVTIHPLPVVTLSPDGGPICSTGTGLTMTASGATTFFWTPGTGLSGTTGAVVTANPTVNTSYTVVGTDVFGCVGTHPFAITVSTPPGAITVSPTSSTMCAGDTTVLLTVLGPVTPSTGAATQTSGTISVAVPDGSATGAATPLVIGGIPAGATITGVTVNFNMNMTWDGDLTINLTAPNGNTLNLVNRRGGSGHNFTNTTVSSAGGLAFASSAAPFTGVFAADAGTGAGTTTLPTTTGVWPALYSVPNGVWQLSVRDWATPDADTITSWTINVSYTYSPIVTWSPVAGLFTDAGADTGYTGGAALSVYAQPAATTTYTATMTVGGCNSTATTIVNVNPAPTPYAVTGGGGYCPGSTGVVVGLSNSEVGVSYQLYNGATAVGVPLAGTGAAISFGLQTAVGTYSVIGTNTTTGCTGGMTGSVNVFIQPLPVVYVVTGGGTYCAGGAGVVIGLSGSDTGVSYQLYNGTTATGSPVTGTGSAFSFGPQTAVGTYTVRGTGISTGCTSNMTGSATISINPVPGAFTVTGGGSYCAGSAGLPIGLSGSAIGIDYVLYNGATPVSAAVAGTGGALIFGLYPAGTYTVLATNGATGCSSAMTGSALIVSVPLPIVYTVTGGGSYCAGGTGVTIGLSNSQTGITYQLYNGSTPEGSPVPGTGSAFSFGTYTAAGTYTVSASNAIGCPTDMSGSVIITINPLPTVFTMTGGGVYCEGGIGVVVGLSGSEAGFSYQLYNGGSAAGAPVTGTGGTISFGLQTAAGTYSVIATNTATGCVSPMDGTAIVFVNPTAPPSVSISTGMSDTVCTGTFISFTAVPVNGGFSPTYQWSVNGIPTGTGPVYSYIPVSGDVIKVQITSSSCASPDTASSIKVITTTSYVSPSVTISVSTGDSTCAGTLATFSATPTFGGTAPAYRWVKNGISVATGPTYTTIPADGDVVYCVLYSSYPCRFADSVVSGSIVMHVTTPVTPTITIGAHPGFTIAPGQTDTLIAFIAGGPGAGTTATYVWKVNGVIVPGATSATYITNTLANGDAVSCFVTVTSGPCGAVTGSNTVHITVTGGAGVGQVNTPGMDVRLLPNPNEGTFTIKGNLGTVNDEEINIEVTDMLGQIVYKNNVTVRRGQLNEQVQMDNTLANGMYILNLRTENGKKTFNFVIGK